jgi:hypothetical protein
LVNHPLRGNVSGIPTSQNSDTPEGLKSWFCRERYRGSNLAFSTLSVGRSRRVFIGGLSQCLGRSLGSGGPLVRPGNHLIWLGGEALWQHRLSHIGYPFCRLKLTCVEDGFRKDAKSWPTGPTLARLGPCFVPCYPLVSYFL